MTDKTWINGKPGKEISVLDRGLHYGDGVFETIAVRQGGPVLLSQHLQRLNAACELLGIPFKADLLATELAEFIDDIHGDCIVKIIVTRGSGSGRGYRPAMRPQPTRILQSYPYPQMEYKSGISVMLCSHRLSHSSGIAGLKHLNRLDQVIASQELSDEVQEGLCRDQEGFLIEGCKSNLVLVTKGCLLTPELTRAGVAGVMLNYLRERFLADGDTMQQGFISLEQLQQAEELFLCNSVFGVWPVIKLLDPECGQSWPIGSFSCRAMEYYDDIFQAGQ